MTASETPLEMKPEALFPLPWVKLKTLARQIQLLKAFALPLPARSQLPLAAQLWSRTLAKTHV
jgi:hypothetical protein